MQLSFFSWTAKYRRNALQESVRPPNCRIRLSCTLPHQNSALFAAFSCLNPILEVCQRERRGIKIRVYIRVTFYNLSILLYIFVTVELPAHSTLSNQTEPDPWANSREKLQNRLGHRIAGRLFTIPGKITASKLSISQPGKTRSPLFLNQMITEQHFRCRR